MTSLRLDDTPRRSLKVALSFLAGALMLVAVTAGLTIHLTAEAARDRVHAELARTVGLLSGGGFPMNDSALERLSEFIQADVVAVDGRGRIVATSLDAKGREAFERARASGAVPLVGAESSVLNGRLGMTAVTVGVAPTGERGGGVYVLYPEDLVAQQARSAWLPVTAVAVVAAILAVLLGVWSERVFQRARTAALLRLLASVGHEVRNPLGAIRTLARSLKTRLGDGVDPQPLELIASEAERLTMLVDGLRAVGLPVRTLRRDIDPDTAVDDVLALIEHQLAHRRVGVERVRAQPTIVSADPAQVRQIVLNLLLNAADAMPRGGCVTITSRLEAGHWQLCVEDNGPGVDPADRARLFEAFFTTKAKGLGVGLFMSRRLVEAHDGTLALDPEFTGGARFVLTWPSAVAAPAPSHRTE